MASLKKYMSAGDVRNAIRRLGKQMASELKDEEIWMSAEFRNYASRMASFILRKYKLFALDILYDTNDSASVAYTDGKKIVLNTGNALARHPKLLEGRFKVNMGILMHECAHKLFIDFDVHHKALDSLKNKKLYGKCVAPAGSDLETNLRELEQALANGYTRAMTSVFAQVTNIVNDGHDESSMKTCFPGFIAQCINAAGDVQMELSTSLEEYVAQDAPKLQVMYSLMLQYAKFGYCNLGEESDATKPYTQMLSRMEPVIDAALAEDDYRARWEHYNMLVLMLWPWIREAMDDAKSNSGNSSPQAGAGGSSGNSGGSGGSMLSDEELEELLEGLAAAAQADNSAQPAPTGTGSAVSPQAVSGGQGANASQDGASDLAAMLEAIGNGKATATVQGDIDKGLLEAIRNVKRPFVHRNVPVKMERHHATDPASYDKIYEEVKPIVSNMISQIQALLRECNEEAVQHHRRYGPIVEATEAYRPDRAFFAKKKLPEDRPNMAMCVLLDESGSMGGSKIQTARKAMIMLERFASGIGVPLMLAGHYTYSGGVALNVYTDFASAKPQEDREALAAISSHGCNRDGLPLRLCADMLAKRPEEIRLMVVISDGAPNDNDYGGEAAFEDIKKTVAEFRRQGLLIYGAAIDDDREVIQDLYGSGFLSITDLKSLPKTLVRLLRQHIV